MTDHDFHTQANALMEALEYGDITYEEFNTAYAEITEEWNASPPD